MSDGQNHHAPGSPTLETRFTASEPSHCRADCHDDRNGRRNRRCTTDHHSDADTKYQHHHDNHRGAEQLNGGFRNTGSVVYTNDNVGAGTLRRRNSYFDSEDRVNDTGDANQRADAVPGHKGTLGEVDAYREPQFHDRAWQNALGPPRTARGVHQGRRR